MIRMLDTHDGISNMRVIIIIIIIIITIIITIIIFIFISISRSTFWLEGAVLCKTWLV